MNTKLQVALECEAPLSSEKLLTKAGDSGFTSSSRYIVSSQLPVKQQIRQWTAWTRQEEESFFNALRQVGKDFEKITCCVQSKNKDQILHYCVGIFGQISTIYVHWHAAAIPINKKCRELLRVRHYYYRLVRRMNKLLGPGFSLNAKNSKDANAAMLRWWSLLEKYSCEAASKLHLKPRRFKIFIEALQHQLLKDRKENIRKRPSQGENCPAASTTTVALPNKASGQDTCSVKLVIVNSQNTQKLGCGKVSSLNHNVNTGLTRSNNKGDLSTLKTARQRCKTGAAYKRWEKAAMAGVSLVTDAAEHLDQASTDKKVSSNQGTLDESFPGLGLVVSPNGQDGIDSVGRVLPPFPVSTYSQHQVKEISARASTKFKLQLFPIDEGTRRALEKDEHNSHLELTLSSRKKISSVLKHLNRKWGNSSIASGELILFPDSVQMENLVDYQRWTQDTIASVADVYALIGSPPVFRLRYGWFSNTELVSVTFRAHSTSLGIEEEHTSLNISNRKEQDVDTTPIAAPLTCDHSQQLPECCEDQLTPMTESTFGSILCHGHQPCQPTCWGKFSVSSADLIQL